MTNDVSQRDSPAHTSRFILQLSALGTARLLGAVVAALLVLHVLLQCTHYLWHPLPWLLLRLFDVDAEDSVPTWYSASSLLFAAVLLLFTAAQRRRNRDRWVGHWYGLAAGFMLLSLDEIAGIHETLNTAIAPSWAIPSLVGCACLAWVYARFLWSLPRKTGVLVATAAFAFLVGAVGVELATDPFFAVCGGDNLSYGLYNAAEEGLEMLGVVLFVYALLDYMGQGRPVRLCLRVSSRL